MNLTTNPPELLYIPDWSAIFAALAFVLSFFAFYFSRFRKGKLTFACARWTALGLDNNGHNGAAFVVNIEVYNTGSTPQTIYDFLLVAITKNGTKIYYEPIFLFSINDYIRCIGQKDQISKANNGVVPIPVIIPNGLTYKFPCEILFMPQDKMTTIILPDDAPIKINLYARIENNNYNKISEQEFSKLDIGNLRNGSFSGVLSTLSIEKRETFIKRNQ